MPQKSNSIILPAEWAPQSAIQIVWPGSDTDWADMLDEVEACYTEIAYEISKRQILIVACEEPAKVKLKLALCVQSNLRFAKTTINDTWARDFGGITILDNNNPYLLDFTFNGWGLKFPSNHDNQITRHLNNQNIFSDKVTLRNMKHFVLEGGSIESDGVGTIMTTEECLLNRNRNSWMDKQKIEDMLISTFGIKRVLWIKNGYLSGDDTDSHIDTLARFCSPSRIAYVKCEDSDDEHFKALTAMESELKSFTQLSGEPYELIALPMAETMYHDGKRLPATYANFLIMNGAVLVPIYGTETDSLALAQLKKAFPEREIVSINCSSLIKQHGSLHCITMQYPEGIVK